MGAYFVLFPHARVVVMVPIFFYPLFFEVPAVTYLLFWALSQVFSGTLAMVGPGGGRRRGLVGTRRRFHRRAWSCTPCSCGRGERSDACNPMSTASKRAWM